MRKLSLAIFFVVICANLVQGQSQSIDTLKLIVLTPEQKEMIKHVQDSIRAKDIKDSTRWANLEANLQYPVLKADKWSGLIPVQNVTEIPDPSIKYKLLFELTYLNKDSAAKDVNLGLVEIARKINLHVASGIPLKNIEPIIVVHAGALHALRKNEGYQKKYKMDNPNIEVINKLKSLGAKFIVCGQAMTYLNLTPEEFVPDTKVSLTAQTVLTHYQLKGYVLFVLDKME